MTSSTPGFATLKKYHPHITGPLIVGAPVRPYALHRLATTVTQAGGLGFISSGATDADEFQAAAAVCAAHPVKTNPPEDGGSPILPVGIGYLCWMTDREQAIAQIAHYRVGAVWLYAWKDLDHLREWVTALRTQCPFAVIYIQVLTVAETFAVLEEGCGGDVTRLVLIAQGSDAGGHGAADGNASLMTFLPELRAALAAAGRGYEAVPLLAAGGVVDGTTAAAALTLGASGLVLGTRLLVTHESGAPPGFRRHLVRASDGGRTTLRTRLFDTLRGTAAFPAAYDGRALRNQSVAQHEQGATVADLTDRYAAALKKWEQRATASERGGDTEAKDDDDDARNERDETWGERGRLTTYAGTGVGLIGDIRPAAAIVREIRAGVTQRLERVRAEVRALE